MKRPLLPTCIVLGISCFAIFIRLNWSPIGQHLTIAFSDIVIGLLLLYALLVHRLTIQSPVLYATLLLVAVTFLSGIVNEWTDRTFSIDDFLANYIRIVGLFAMVLLLPSLIRKISHDRLAQSTLWAVRLHALLLFADSLSLSPLDWSDAGVAWRQGEATFLRPRGLFGEPSNFAVYMGLSLFYILQVERNTGARYIRVFDIILLSLALVTSTSVSSGGVLGLFLMVLAMRSGLKHRAKVSVGVAVFALLLGLVVTTFRDVGPGRHWEYIVRRVSAVQPHRFEDDSGRQRLIGSSLLALEVFKEAPLLGAGLGGTNVNRLLDRYGQYDSRHVAPLSLTITPAAVIAASGIIGFLPYVFIYGWTLRTPETRLIGLSFLAVALMWGGAFEVILWWHICLAVSLKGGYRRRAGQLSRGWRSDVLPSPA